MLSPRIAHNAQAMPLPFLLASHEPQMHPRGSRGSSTDNWATGQAAGRGMSRYYWRELRDLVSISGVVPSRSAKSQIPELAAAQLVCAALVRSGVLLSTFMMAEMPGGKTRTKTSERKRGSRTTRWGTKQRAASFGPGSESRLVMGIVRSCCTKDRPTFALCHRMN